MKNKVKKKQKLLGPKPYTLVASGSPGFTLVEMIVAIALFAVVMLIAVGALLSLTGANRKAQALQSVMNNLNIALDGMVRNIRMGTNYQCGGGDAQGNCSGGGTFFTFKPNPDVSNASAWIYRFDSVGTYCGAHRICRSQDGTTYTAITAPEVSIDSGSVFYVVGAQAGDPSFIQPKVIIVVKGTAGALSLKTKTTFHIQASAVQRELDLAQ